MLNALTSRRQFLATAGAAAVSCSLAPRRASAQAGSGSYVRKNLDDPATAPMVASYEKAVAAMLKLPPTDPRNWYRNAMIHLMDCPHGNWWFLPWHRGYLGWFEQTCRELSGNPQFALPYWDWTQEEGNNDLGIPDSFNQDNALNPFSSLYLNGFADFRSEFEGAVSESYSSLTEAQLMELQARGMETEAKFWASAGGSFTNRSNARQPNFDQAVQVDVSLETILNALAAQTFTASSGGFGSDQAMQHSGFSGSDILEAQPHNNIHNAVGGFMADFPSPVDPIFFMHHCNIDRLWDVWTRKQQQHGLPTLPQSGLKNWNNEPFLFYIGSNGKPVATDPSQAGGTCAPYATIGAFNYSYQPGSGESIISEKRSPSEFVNNLIAATTQAKSVASNRHLFAAAALPDALHSEVAERKTTDLIARVGLQLPHGVKGLRFHVLVNPPEDAVNVPVDDPSFAGTITPFGVGHGHAHGSSTFSVSLTNAVRRLGEAGRLKKGQKLDIRVVLDSNGVTLKKVEVPVTSVTVSAL